MIKIAIPGAAGKMGRTLITAIAETPGTALAAAVERPGHPSIGRDAWALAGLAAEHAAFPIGDDASALLTADVVIDFTVPAATATLAPRAADAGVALVIGTTGLAEPERRTVEQAATRVPIVFSPNMSIGVNVLFRLLGDAARALGEGFDLEILEAHHRQKRDAPSGTAARMADVLAAARGLDLARAGCYGRQGASGARPSDQIGVMALRGGDVVGDHTAYFFGDGERLEITHRASSRMAFARGAVRAALWLAGKKPGLYSMQDVLGLR